MLRKLRKWLVLALRLGFREVKRLFTCDLYHSKWGQEVMHRIFDKPRDLHHS